MSKVNQEWFRERLRVIKMSQRTLAKKVGLDPASMSNTFSGKRRMTMEEAREIASHLMLPVTEVMRQAGIDVLDDVRRIPVAGYIGAKGQVTLLPNGTHDTVIAPADTPTGSFALQMRRVNAIEDGWLYFVSGTQRSALECVDRLSLVALDDGRLLKGVVRRGYKKDTYNLVVISEGEQVLENCKIAWGAPIVWIQPS